MRNSQPHETVPAWFHADCADVGPRVRYVTSSQRPEELRGPGVLGGGGMGLSVCIGHAVGIGLTKRRTMANYLLGWRSYSLISKKTQNFY